MARATLSEPAPLSPNALIILRERYLRRNERLEVIETPDEMFRRVARAVAQADARYGPPDAVEAAAEEFYQAMASLEFLPNSPALMNAGTPLQQLMACFVLPVEDSLASIFETLKLAALIQQTGAVPDSRSRACGRAAMSLPVPRGSPRGRSRSWPSTTR